MTKKHIAMGERQVYAKRLNRRINKIRKQYDLTISALAREIGIPPPTFWSWSAGKSCPKNITVYNKVMSDLHILDLTSKKLAEQQLILDLREPETTGLADADHSPVRGFPNPEPVSFEPNPEPLVEDKMLVLPRKDLMKIISNGLNAFMATNSYTYTVTDIIFDGKSGRILFTGGG